MPDTASLALLDLAGLRPLSCDRPVNTRRVGYKRCGKCDPCLADKTYRLAAELQFEIDAHDGASFFTGTFAPESLPADASAWRDVARLWRKQFRNGWTRSGFDLGPVPRIFLAFELGDKTGRPHVHALIFTPYADFAGQLAAKAWRWGFAKVRAQLPGTGKCGSYVAAYVCKPAQWTPAQLEALKTWGPVPRAQYPRRPGLGRAVADVLVRDLGRKPAALAHWREIGAPVRLRVSNEKGRSYIKTLRPQTVKRVHDALLTDADRQKRSRDAWAAHLRGLEYFGGDYGAALSDPSAARARMRRARIGREGYGR